MSTTVTPNVGLQVPAFNQGNWNVPYNYNWNLLDLIFGGDITIPALSVTTLTAANLFSLLTAAAVAEAPDGAVPGTTYTLSNTPAALVAFCINGLLQRMDIDYTLTGNVITLGSATNPGDTVFAVYFKVA